jgi:hypothetical protein
LYTINAKRNLAHESLCFVLPRGNAIGNDAVDRIARSPAP